MLRFLDGPAAGVLLSCRRAPLYLRAVRDAEGVWDALDQLADTPEPSEAVFTYRKVRGGTVHMDGTDRRGRRIGWTEMLGDYTVVAEQPDEAVLRDTAAWRHWCLEQVNP